MGGGPANAIPPQSAPKRLRSSHARPKLTAKEHLGVGGGSGEVLLDHGRVDESYATVPLLGRVVEDVEDGETLGVLGGERVELGLEENVLVRHVGVYEGELGHVQRVLE